MPVLPLPQAAQRRTHVLELHGRWVLDRLRQLAPRRAMPAQVAEHQGHSQQVARRDVREAEEGV